MTTEQIKDIPDIPQLQDFKHLFDEIVNGKAIIFIGNGVSRLCGVPSWKELALQYLKEWRNNDLEYNDLPQDTYEKLQKEEPLKLLSLCIDRLGFNRDTLNNYITNKLCDADKKRLDILYGYLRDFKAGYVTTNYDEFLKNAPVTNDELLIKENQLLETLKEDSFDKLEEIDFSNSMEKPRNKLLHLHGKSYQTTGEDKNPLPPILTLSDYNNHYKENKGKGRLFLRKIFQKNYLLFIGFPLNEFEIIEHISPPSDAQTRHYILLGLHDYEKSILKIYKKYYDKLNIELIPFNISKRGYNQLEFVLENWSMQVRKARIQNYEKTIKDKKKLEAKIAIDKISGVKFE